jgi:hypothetical protein
MLATNGAPAPVSADTTTPVLVASPAEPPVPPTDGTTPVYKKWWFWTAVGAVVIAGVVAGVALSREQTPSCPEGRVCL